MNIGDTVTFVDEGSQTYTVTKIQGAKSKNAKKGWIWGTNKEGEEIVLGPPHHLKIVST